MTLPVVLDRSKAIRAKCLDCSADQPGEVRLCSRSACALFPWRMGRQPDHPATIAANKAALEASPDMAPAYDGWLGQ